MIKPRLLANEAYEHLLRMILAGDLAPGQWLREGELAALLGVSRTPVREALQRLAEYGVVETKPNHGAVVRRLGREELIHFHQVREALEGMAAELACGRLTRDDVAALETLAEASRDPSSPGYFAAFDRFDVGLHGLVAERSGNPLLAREIKRLLGLTMLIHDQLETVLIDSSHIPAGERVEIRDMCWRQHCQILAALRAGEPAACRRFMVEHVRSSCEYKVRLLPPGP